MLVVFDKRIIINGGMVVLKRERRSEKKQKAKSYCREPKA
jgi:hypothetical protein